VLPKKRKSTRKGGIGKHTKIVLGSAGTLKQMSITAGLPTVEWCVIKLVYTDAVQVVNDSNLFELSSN
jgi:hypothetical protein